MGRLAGEDRKRIGTMLLKYGSVFGEVTTEPFNLKMNHRINTGNAKPIFQRPYKILYYQRNIVEKQVKELQDKGIISPSVSQWSL